MKHEWIKVVWTSDKVCKHCGARTTLKNGEVMFAPQTDMNETPKWTTKKPKCCQ